MDHIQAINNQSFSQRVRGRKGALAIAILLSLALTYGVLLSRPFEYQATVQMLIIQNQTGSQDLLSTLRATEQVGQSLVDVVYASTFFDKVLASKYPITRKFSDQPERRREEWRRAVSASVAQQSGIITVSVFDPDREQATVIARGIADVLTNQSQEFHGKSDIIVKVIDDVYSRQWPVKPNLVGSTLAALFFGALAGFALIALLPAPRHRTHQGKKPIVKKPDADHLGDLPRITGRTDDDREARQAEPPDGLPVDVEVDDA